ncbi:nucleotidyltransferase domain-containing protein [Methanobacterium sp.]|uniref:nucleotidyltransferase domain-containing protein n=1 Tax=Methanobacterium sp. TaxID=2164 RepID=UPI003C773F16
MEHNNDLKLKMSVEQKLLICCARTYVNKEIKAEILSLVQENINWKHLTQFAVRHRLTNLLYSHLNRICPESIPENVLQNLRSIYQENSRNNLLLTGELFNILEILKSANLNGIPYKGPSLAILAYKNLSLRQFSDLDVFISKSDVLKVKDLLSSNGYHLYHDLDYIKGSFYLETQREYAFINEKTGAIIEIHWNFHGASMSLRDEENCLYDNLKTMNLNGHDILSLKTENLILILCIHCSNHDWDSLSWICDISELIGSNENIDWQYLLKTAEKLGIRRILLVNLLLIENLWKINIPEQIMNYIISDQSIHDLSKIIGNRLFLEDENGFTFFKKAVFDFKKRESAICGIKDVIYMMLVPTYIDFVDIRLPSSLYPLYYIIRPLLLFRRLGFKPINSNTK